MQKSSHVVVHMSNLVIQQQKKQQRNTWLTVFAIKIYTEEMFQ